MICYKPPYVWAKQAQTIALKDQTARSLLLRACKPGKENVLLYMCMKTLQFSPHIEKIPEVKLILLIALTTEDDTKTTSGLGKLLQTIDNKARTGDSLFLQLSKANPNRAADLLRKVLKLASKDTPTINLKQTVNLIWYWEPGKVGSWRKIAQEFYLNGLIKETLSTPSHSHVNQPLATS